MAVTCFSVSRALGSRRLPYLIRLRPGHWEPALNVRNRRGRRGEEGPGCPGVVAGGVAGQNGQRLWARSLAGEYETSQLWTDGQMEIQGEQWGWG